MEPEVYKRFNSFMVDLPHQVPVDEQPEQALDQSMAESSEQSRPSDTSWTVYSPNVTRGNLQRELDSSDLRMSVGWNADATAAQRSKNPGSWMSTTQQQPLMADTGFWEWAPKDDEVSVEFLFCPQFQNISMTFLE